MREVPGSIPGQTLFFLLFLLGLISGQFMPVPFAVSRCPEECDVCAAANLGGIANLGDTVQACQLAITW